MVLAVLIPLMVLTGCDDDDDDNSAILSPDFDPAPKINGVSLYEYDEITNVVSDWEYPYEFWQNSLIMFDVNFTDHDSNIRHLYAEYYYEGSTTASGTEQIIVPPTPDIYFNYFFEYFAHRVSGPSGLWRIVFYAVDEDGFESNRCEVYYQVR